MNNFLTPPTLGVSSWAFHAELGAPLIWGVEAEAFDAPEGSITLLQVPALLAERGFSCWQLCHFHLPTLDASYLDELRAASDEAGLSLHALLADAGDITHPQHGAHDADWIASWIEVAARLGARNLRAIARQTLAPDALKQSARCLLELARSGRERGVGIITENWFDVLSTPDAVLDLMARTDGEIGLLLDWSNWNGPHKYQRLAQIAPLASSCHVQLEFISPAEINRDDCQRCLDLPYPTEFSGPFILVNGGLQGIEVARDALLNTALCSS